jgi:hypothetical protein
MARTAASTPLPAPISHSASRSFLMFSSGVSFLFDESSCGAARRYLSYHLDQISGALHIKKSYKLHPKSFAFHFALMRK